MMKKRILLINPNYTYFPGWLSTAVNYKGLSLGLAYIAGFLRKQNNVKVRIFDAVILNATIKDIILDIKKFNPDIIGITTTTITINGARQIAQAAKKILKDIIIVLGGPHVSALPFENLDVANFCVIGEGEVTFSELVTEINNQKAWDNIKGISFKKNGEFVKTPSRNLIENLDCLPFPARDLLPEHKFMHIYPYRLNNPYYENLVTSRGCNFNCNFCLNDLMWQKRTRYRSLNSVFEEIDILVKNKNTSVLFFQDDNFTSNFDRIYEFCTKKRIYFPDLKWICHARVDFLTLPLLKEMESAGCVEIQLGVESGENSILSDSNKSFKKESIIKAFNFIRKTKINSWATVIIGHENDTKATVEETIKFVKAIDPTYCTFLFLSPLPGTKTFADFSKKRFIKTYDWDKYGWHGEPVFETHLLNRKMLLKLRRKAYCDFYIRPKNFLKYFHILFYRKQFSTIINNLLIMIKFIFSPVK
ncbi:MAG: radical SAM protein [Candidatus Omnitrophota bacterium]